MLFTIDSIDALPVESVLVSERALAQVPRRARHRILKKAVKMVEIKQAEKAAGNWNSVLGWLERLRAHLDLFTSKLAENIMENMNEGETGLVRSLELTVGHTDQIMKLIIQSIADQTNKESIR